MHGNYVDCVRWFGDLILSKSVEQSISLWQPDIGVGTGNTFRKVLQYSVKDADIWFMRFALDAECKTMVCGNRVGDSFVWRMHTRPPVKLGVLSDRGCKKTVRQTAISADGKTVIVVCDGGTVWRWDFAEYKEIKPAARVRKGYAIVQECEAEETSDGVEGEKDGDNLGAQDDSSGGVIVNDDE